MLSIGKVTKKTKRDYFAKDSNYYTRNMTNRDCWFGNLAKCLGPLSQASYDAVREHILAQGRTRIGVDCVFSAPKSVSLALTVSPEIREIILWLHYEAVSKVLAAIEKDYIFTRVRHGKNDRKRKWIKTGNMIAACFTHFVSRAEDMDLHTHCVIANLTMLNGREYSIEFGELMDHEKELGLLYRRELTKGLMREGFALELTDRRKGFFELKGFSRSVIDEFSQRHEEIMAIGASTSRELSKAAKLTRKKKRKVDLDEKFEEVHNELFEHGIAVERRAHHGPALGEDKERGKNTGGQGCDREQQQNPTAAGWGNMLGAVEGRSGNYPDFAGAAAFDSFSETEGQEFGEAAGFPAMQELPVFDDAAAGKGTDRILHGNALHLLAQLQSERQRDLLLQQAAGNRKRIERTRMAESVIEGLAREKFAFTKREAIYRIMAAGLLDGIDEREARRLLASLPVIVIGRLRTEAGMLSKENYITTRKNLETEKAVLKTAANGKGLFRYTAKTASESASIINDLIEVRRKRGEEFTPTDEQRTAVIHALTCPDQFLAIQGMAGVGKTYIMEAFREICENQGITLCGMAFSGKAADELQADSGIESSTIHSFLGKLEKESGVEVPKADGIRQEWDFSQLKKSTKHGIWIVDEAGLIDMHLMNQLMTAAKARRAQVIFSGDYSQLPPVGAGEPYRQMIDNGLATAYLEDIRRQKNLELRQAVIESVKGNPLKTFQVLDKSGRYIEIENNNERHSAIAEAATLMMATDYKNQLILVATNKDRKRLNKLIRNIYVERGEISKGQKYAVTIHTNDKEIVEYRNFAKGDRIVFLANDKKIGVMNGTLATITEIDEFGKKFTVTTDAGGKREFFIDSYSKIDYAYALTNYKAQGMTVSRVIADMPTMGAVESRNALYVDISRAKFDAMVFTDNKKLLEKQTEKFVRKVTSKDFEIATLNMERGSRVVGNPNYSEAAQISEGLEENSADIKTEEIKTEVMDYGESYRADDEEEAQRAGNRNSIFEGENNDAPEQSEKRETEERRYGGEIAGSEEGDFPDAREVADAGNAVDRFDGEKPQSGRRKQLAAKKDGRGGTGR